MIIGVLGPLGLLEGAWVLKGRVFCSITASVTLLGVLMPLLILENGLERA